MNVYVAMLQEDDGAYLLGVHATRIGAQSIALEKDPVQQVVGPWVEVDRGSTHKARTWCADRKRGGRLFVFEQELVGEPR